MSHDHEKPAITIGELDGMRERLSLQFEAANPKHETKIELRGQLKLITELMLKHKA